MDTKLPFVSAMIVVRNGEKVIGRCLDSLFGQDYPKDKYEILIIDGMSVDNTLKIVEAASTREVVVRVLKNPKKILACGWNIGIREARGDYVVRLDAHAIAESDFISKNIETLTRMPEVACVGGSMETRSTTLLGKAISNVLSSPFGVGNSKFRTSKKAQYVDTVAYGMYRRAVILQAGGLNEELGRNQDIDLHGRIRRAGWKFYLETSIRTTYFSRDNYYDFIKQAWQNGWWNIVSFVNNMNSLSVRHLVPLMFVSGLIVLTVGSFISQTVLLGLICLICIYFTLTLIASTLHAKIIWIYIPINPFLYFSLHTSYGIGSLASLLNITGKSLWSFTRRIAHI